jgi:predicted metalloprotease
VDLPAPGAPPSKNVIDARARASLTRRGGIFAALLAAFGLGRVTTPSPDPDADLVTLTSAALDRAQDYWAPRVAAAGVAWRDARVVLVDRPERTPCGTVDRTSGPFYCPADQRVYLDLTFLRAVDGQLARAYVIAHEIGHHVQRLVGDRPGATSVDVELEADCYAGEWVRDEVERGRVSGGDVDDALAEAAAVGDDRICPSCSPETWTHGSSAERAAAFRRGITGDGCR